MIVGSRRALVAGLAAVAGCGGRERQVETGASGAAALERAVEPAGPGGPGFALVELFSSEGCSSCPPADDVLEEVRRAGPANVLTLAFHVDYWDELGWPDPFASAAFTRRQQDYVDGLGLRQLYTPQMVVNGRREFVGSERRLARAAIDEALGRPAPVGLTLGAVRPVAGGREVSFTMTAAPADAELFVAAVEGPLVSVVKRGENAGRTLHHGSVVRSLARAPARASGALTLPAAGGRVVAWVQRRGGPVLGATAAAAG